MILKAIFEVFPYILNFNVNPFMKYFVFFILTSVWITGILAPPIIQLIEGTEPLLSININEEEPQEQGKKDLDEEIILSNLTGYQMVSTFKNPTQSNWEHRLFYLPHITEIQLPPPERSL